MQSKWIMIVLHIPPAVFERCPSLAIYCISIVVFTHQTVRHTIQFPAASTHFYRTITRPAFRAQRIERKFWFGQIIHIPQTKNHLFKKNINQTNKSVFCLREFRYHSHWPSVRDSINWTLFDISRVGQIKRLRRNVTRFGWNWQRGGGIQKKHNLIERWV